MGNNPLRPASTEEVIAEINRVYGPPSARMDPPRPLAIVPPRDEAELEALMVEVLTTAQQHPFFTKSNFARDKATVIAEAACRGWITVETTRGVFGNKWFVTELGLGALNKHGA